MKKGFGSDIIIKFEANILIIWRSATFQEHCALLSLFLKMKSRMQKNKYLNLELLLGTLALNIVLQLAN